MMEDKCGALLVLLLCCLGANCQITLTGPSSAAEGSTVTFTCTTSPVQIGVTWSFTSGSNINNYIYFHNSGTGRCQRSTGSPPPDYTFDCNSTGVFTLSFPADYSRHNGSVLQCGNSGGGGESNSITLSVTVQYTLTGPSSAAEGSTVSFTCTTSPAQNGVTWKEKSGSNVNYYIYFYNSATGRCQRSTGSPPPDYSFDCNSTAVFSLSFPADYSKHNGSVFTCSDSAGPGKSNNVTLSITGRKPFQSSTSFASGSKGPPDAPTELLLWSDGPNSVRLSWKKGSNGGAKQHFRVQYKNETGLWAEVQDLYEDNEDLFVQGNIQGLKPESLYFVRVQSFNIYGNSSFSAVERVLTQDEVCSCDREEGTSSSSQILLGAGICLFVLSVIFTSTMAIIFFRHKRTKKGSKIQGNSSHMTEDNYANLDTRTGNTYEDLQQNQTTEQHAEYSNTEATF